MTTIILPPEIEQSVARQAEQQGTTLELLAQDALRRMFAPSVEKPNSEKPNSEKPNSEKPNSPETLYDFMQGYIGTVDGSSKAYSENCGEKFAEGMAQKQRQGKL